MTGGKQMLLSTLAFRLGHPPLQRRILHVRHHARFSPNQFRENGHSPSHSGGLYSLGRHLARPVLHISTTVVNLKKVALAYHTGGISLAEL